MFDSRALKLKIGDTICQDRFRSVELAATFKRLTCYKCDLTAVYKYRVQQLRRNAEISGEENEPCDAPQVEAWKSIPRFAEIPETVRCKGCGEVLGIFPFCIF